MLLNLTQDLANDPNAPLITDDKIVFGILMGILGLIFYTSSKEGGWKKFYKIIPALFLCYFIPAILTTVGLISPEYSDLYTMAKYYCLPAALILMTLSIDLPGILKLGPKALIMFGTATVGIILGGPIAVMLTSTFSPDTVGGEGADAAWRGLSTLAGSWIGGGANQTAMLEVYGYNKDLYGGMVTVDIVVANVLMAGLLLGIGNKEKIDKWLKADNSAIDELVVKMENFEKSVSKKATTTDYMKILGVAFIGVSVSHFLSDILADYFTSIAAKPEESVVASKFFWLVLIATFFGFGASFTNARKLEGVGASKFGSICIYILVATIGMKMDLLKVLDNPLLIVVGVIWIIFHIGLLFLVAKLIKAPYFFLAVGSQANVGGAASAPVVAGAFHPSLTTVGVLLAVLGYFVGTIGAIICAEMMQAVAPM
ncbi:MAG: DUF819 family protein [Crocinitomicaceae bacterium]|nr:DUF819 family protein [Crocinitomicaceae bacterium]